MKAARMLAQNIERLLRARHQSQHDLAQWCRHSDVWLSLFLAGKREVQLKDLDRIADFFGKSTYELFIPGGTMERRSGHDRRTNRERRTGSQERVMLGLAEQIAPYRKAGPHVATSSPFAEELRRLSERHEREISTLISRAESRGQAATPRRAQPKASKSRGDVGGRDADPAGNG